MPTVKVQAGDTLNSIAQRYGFKNYKEAGIDPTSLRSGNADLIYPDEQITIGAPKVPTAATPGAGTAGAAGALPVANGVGSYQGGGTAGASLEDRYGIRSNEDAALNRIVDNAGRVATSRLDEGEIRRRNVSLFQDQIDAVNQIYDSLVAGEKIAGADRVGQGRAISNRQGLVGSMRGETQRANIVARNQEIMQTIQAERAFKIGQILGEAQRQSLEEIQAERAAKRQGAQDYIDLIVTQDERRAKNLQTTLASLVSQGVTLDELSKDDMADLSKMLKVPEAQIRTTYETLTANGDPEQFTLGRYDIRYDSEGNVIARGASAGGAGGSGSVTPSQNGDINDFVEVLSFEEFKNTQEAKDIIAAEEERLQMNFLQSKRDAILREAYNQELAAIQSETKKIPSSVNLGSLTPTNRRDLSQAGLISSDTATQSFFLNLPASIRDDIQRGVAAGIISPSDLTIEQMQEVLESEGGSSTKKTEQSLDDKINNL